MSSGQRFRWIDFTRGIIMCIMAWDHVSGFWYPAHYGSEGLGGGFPYRGAELLNYMLRFVTHFCAPTFFFLSGVSLAISCARRLSRGESQRSVSMHLIGRAAALFAIMIFIEGNSFGSSPLYFGVMGCFAVCFILFTVYRRLPWQAILAVSLAIVLFHPYLDLTFLGNQGLGLILRSYIHEPALGVSPLTVLYPVIPWIGVMGIGWCLGLYLNGLDAAGARKLAVPFAASGVLLWVAFFAIRWFNGFGNLVYRTEDTVQGWLAVSKYPPDLAFLTVTLGGCCLLLALGILLDEKPWFDRGLTGAMLVFGRNALFFYALHLPMYRVRPFFMTRPLFSMDLPTTLATWIIGLIVLHRLCIRYEKYKRSHPESLTQYV